MFLKNLTHSLVIFGLVLFFGVTVVESAINSSMDVAKNTPMHAKELLYRVTSNNLEEMKNSLVKINLHMREGAGKAKPNIKIVIHGEGAKLFYGRNMDPELKYMVDWFLAEDVQFGLCRTCRENFDIDLNSFPEGFVKFENQ